VCLAGLLASALTGCGGSGGGPSSARSASPSASGTTSAKTSSGTTRLSASTSSSDASRLTGLIALGKPIYCAAPRGNEVALTFDDGPGPYTRLVLRKLRKHGVAATFFDVGRNIPLEPGTIPQERMIGAVGDHTFTHPLLTSLAPAAAREEITRTQVALAGASHGPIVLFRPPYGAHDSTIDGIVRSRGMLQILWTVDSADSLGANYAQIERNVISGLRPGAIILMHENHGQTVRALLSIFAALQSRHLRAVSVPRLLVDDPPSAAQVRAGGLGCGLEKGRALTGG
jgi:peptidoglycan-N-acetylglucosamine deacetylase